MHMPDVPVAPDAGHLFKMFRIVRNGDRLHHGLMTVPARFLGDAPVAFGYLDRLMKAAHRKVIGVPETVSCLGVVFTGEIVWRVAVVAGSNCVVAALLPPVELLVHDVAVGARA